METPPASPISITDSNGLVACAVAADSKHARALAITQTLIDNQHTILDPGAVCAATSNALGRHGGHAVALATAKVLRESRVLRIVGAGDQLFSALGLVRTNGYPVSCAADERRAAA